MRIESILAQIRGGCLRFPPHSVGKRDIALRAPTASENSIYFVLCAHRSEFVVGFGEFSTCFVVRVVYSVRWVHGAYVAWDWSVTCMRPLYCPHHQVWAEILNIEVDSAGHKFRVSPKPAQFLACRRPCVFTAIRRSIGLRYYHAPHRFGSTYACRCVQNRVNGLPVSVAASQ